MMVLRITRNQNEGEKDYKSRPNFTLRKVNPIQSYAYISLL
jgi:hypothetical protein